ncbi:MAG: endonuclease domain-containing protein, partial [Candidatus Roizmanbacteria bacterium]|nr:endonuclease domain-containing protein [Candidatus Roizmanbacteria bacterium]
EAKKNRSLVGIGGGKDSIVAIELLKKERKHVTGLILETGHSHIQREVAKTAGIKFLLVKRRLDNKLFELENIYNGHVPFSAIFAFIALLVSVIYDYSSIITANEKSSNFGNLNYLGSEINHQWSKSEEFENLFKDYVRKFITPDVNYFSILKDYSELEITEMLVKYKKYFPFFSSCNRNFKIKSNIDQKRWCGECAKCAFVFTILAANLSKEEIVGIFDKNLLDDPELIPLYQDLIGKGKMKPFDCVGTFEESVQAFKMIKSKGEFNNEVVMKTIEKLI